MTLEQTEYQKLMEYLIGLIEEYLIDPYTLGAILSELKDLYRTVSIYPGIIMLCLHKVVQPIKIDELKEGDETILLLKNGQRVSGKITELDQDKIKVSNYRSEMISVQKSDIGETKIIVRSILEKEWPSLSFKEEEAEIREYQNIKE